jgi:hypothetical protein
MRSLKSPESERGAVVVMVAIWLPVLALFVSFAVDFAHFFDYSRNLQNRADAAALAASVAYGTTCFNNPTAAQTDSIGKVAQQYAGPPIQNPGSPYTVPNNLPYAYSTFTQSQYLNVPNLTKGTPQNFHIRLNSRRNWPDGANWEMGTAGKNTSSLALCSSTDEDGNEGPMVDVRLTQANLGLFFTLFNFSPSISAHARAGLQGEASTNAAPIAVGDTGQIPCVSARLVNATTNALIQTVTLTKKPPDPLNPTAPFQWDNSAAPASFTMPASDNVYVQPFLSDCNGTGQVYDDGPSPNPGPTGLLMINSRPATNPTVANGTAPQLNATGVYATSNTAACSPPLNVQGTQYFSSGGCSITVNAGVTFAGNVGNGGQNVFVRLRTYDPGTGAWVLGPQTSLHRPGTAGCPNIAPNNVAWCGDPTIADQSGNSELVIDWKQTSDTINGTSCQGNPTPAVCQGSFGVQAQSFGACNGCNQPDDSGPIVFSQISEPGVGLDSNSLARGSTHNLVFTFRLSGLNTAAPTDPPTVLRFANSTNHQTGLIDCGQGSGAQNDAAVVYYGCGPGNPLVPGMNPLFVYSRPAGSDCSPAIDGNTTGWPNGNNQDCVETTPGQRRVAIVCALVDRIVNNPYGTQCTGSATGTCPDNNWTTQNIQPGDPRAVQMIVTSTADFASGAGSPQSWLPIRKFATFYVTGWDNSIKPQCPGSPGHPGNEPYPGKNKNNSDNGAVWGHWINYEDTAGTPNGQTCVIGTSPTNCVPALTR